MILFIIAYCICYSLSLYLSISQGLSFSHLILKKNANKKRLEFSSGNNHQEDMSLRKQANNALISLDDSNASYFKNRIEFVYYHFKAFINKIVCF